MGAVTVEALIEYAEQNGLAYEYEYTPAFAKWQRVPSPEQYEIAEVRTSRGVSRVMLFSKAIIQAGIPQIRQATARRRRPHRSSRPSSIHHPHQAPAKAYRTRARGILGKLDPEH